MSSLKNSQRNFPWCWPALRWSFLIAECLPFDMDNLSEVNSGGIMLILFMLLLQGIKEYTQINNECWHYHDADNH